MSTDPQIIADLSVMRTIIENVVANEEPNCVEAMERIAAFVAGQVAKAEPQTLGQRLAEQIAARKPGSEAAIRAKQRTAVEQAEFDKKERDMRAFFIDTREMIVARIGDGIEGLEFRVPATLETYGWTDKSTIASPKHPMHYIWREFEDWATENGLKDTFHYRHDGGGMDSWYVLAITPLDAVP